MATTTRIERNVTDEEGGNPPVHVSWADDMPPYLVVTQGSDTIHMSREHAGAVVAAIEAALSDPA